MYKRQVQLFVHTYSIPLFFYFATLCGGALTHNFEVGVTAFGFHYLLCLERSERDGHKNEINSINASLAS